MAAPGPGQGLEVGEIERQVAELWRQAGSKDDAVMRACTLNLVVPCEAGDVSVPGAVAALSEHRPCRAIVVMADAASEEHALQGWVSAHCHPGAGGRQVCSEQITLDARGDAVELVPESVLQLFCGDLPVHTWWRRRKMEADVLFRSLARLSERFLVDTSAFEDPATSLSSLVALAADRSFRGHVADLAWTRLEPWREMVASAFDAPSTRPLLDRPVSLVVRAGGGSDKKDGITAAGAYLAGWIVSRLEWTPDPAAIRLERDPRFGGGEVGSLRFTAGAAAVASLIAERLGPQSDLVRVVVEMEGSCPLPRVLKLPRRDEISLLCRATDRTGPDPVFEAALSCAAQLAGGGDPGAEVP